MIFPRSVCSSRILRVVFWWMDACSHVSLTNGLCCVFLNRFHCRQYIPPLRDFEAWLFIRAGYIQLVQNSWNYFPLQCTNMKHRMIGHHLSNQIIAHEARKFLARDTLFDTLRRGASLPRVLITIACFSIVPKKSLPKFCISHQKSLLKLQTSYVL